MVVLEFNTLAVNYSYKNIPLEKNLCTTLLYLFLVLPLALE